MGRSCVLLIAIVIRIKRHAIRPHAVIRARVGDVSLALLVVAAVVALVVVAHLAPPFQVMAARCAANIVE